MTQGQIKVHPCQKQEVAQQLSTKLSAKAPLNSCTRDSTLDKLEELLLGVHEDVLVPCHNLHPLPDLPDERFCICICICPKIWYSAKKIIFILKIGPCLEILDPAKINMKCSSCFIKFLDAIDSIS